MATGSMNVKVSIKQSFKFKVVFSVILLLGRLRLLSMERACDVVNHMLDRGEVRYRIGKGIWRPLDVGQLVVIENDN
ncbi:hypothetical protein [Evansella tamaricis]|uniref:Uncharacterized protein n=1 Tax=Evansella tamaricis TaxID=2069301 RepID=A0ABS6JBP3_9BACI|nr:hypothetical protein [Evansella tamaricis]MBU9711070.1 hypothetical protein [Evansella tamaricis]